MGKYTISMDYNEFEKFVKIEKELKGLKKELAECYDYDVPFGTPMTVSVKKLKEISSRFIPVPLEENQGFIDV